MRTNLDLDAAFAELVRAADAAFPHTREPATKSSSRMSPRRWLLLTAAVAVVAMTLGLTLGPWGSSGRHAAPAVSTVLPPSAGFPGRWLSTDVVDGSAQTFDVSRSATGGTFATRLHDTVATVACGGGPADVQGPGRLASGELFVTFTVSCSGSGVPPAQSRVGYAFYFYHSKSDTLTDGSGNVWHRAPEHVGIRPTN
jgi:hypothetical protein